jgi:hypothetical protein
VELCELRLTIFLSQFREPFYLYTVKRFLTALVAIMYFVISSGVVVNIHYCMGRVKEVKYQTLAEKKCGCGKMAAKNCCKTSFKLVKLEDAQKASTAFYKIEAPAAILTSAVSLYLAPMIPSADRDYVYGHSPPLLSAQDTYLQNCVFRI